MIKKLLNLDLFSKLLFAITLLIVISVNVIYSKNPILDQYGFRQTQTALTSYYLNKNGFSVGYETPVVGKPWSIPFEFPIYQQVVALTSKLFNAPLTQTGRLVSLLFFILSCIPIFSTLSKLKIDQKSIYFSLALFLSSPIYIFWSGTFMIESAALFFALIFLYYAVNLIQRNWSTSNFVLFATFLLLASLQKITTILPICLLVGIIIIFFSINREDFRLRLVRLFGLLGSCVLPLLLVYMWIRYTDLIKMENPIGLKLTSKALSSWNYGTIDLRLSKQFWLDVIFNRNIKATSFYGLGVVAVCATFFLSKDKLLKNILLGSSLLFLLPFLIFSNLHSIHTYYQFANSIFLSVAVGISICFLCNRYLGQRPAIQGIVLLTFILSNYLFFCSTYYHDKSKVINLENNKVLKLSDFIKSHTPLNKPVIWYGFDWSSEAAFYSERKSLTVPDWDFLVIDSIKTPEIFLGEDIPSAIVLCPMAKYDMVKIEITKKYPLAITNQIEDCQVYLL
jgi:hypothetical protein